MIALLATTSAAAPSAVALSPDGSYAVVGAEDGTRTVWRSDGRPPVAVRPVPLEAPGRFFGELPWDAVRAIVVSADGRTAASTHEVGAIAIFDPRTGRSGVTVPIDGPVPESVPWTRLRVESDGSVWGGMCGNGPRMWAPAVLSDDGRLLLTTSGGVDAPRAVLWSTSTGAMLRVWTSDEPIAALGFDADRRPVVRAGAELVVLGETPWFVVGGVISARPVQGGAVEVTGLGGVALVDLSTGAATAAQPLPEPQESGLHARSADGTVRVWVGSDGVPRFTEASGP